MVLKKRILNRIIITTATLFTLFLLTLVPKTSVLDVPESLEYVDYTLENSVIYLIDQYDYVARTAVALEHNSDIDKKAKQMLEFLIISGKEESKIPSGFKAIIPSDTKILSVEYVEGTIKVNFSKNILEIDEKNENKMIESIVYTLTSIENVKNVIIYVEGDILTKLPSGKILPTSLDRSYGINREYNITTYKNIDKVTIYYLGKYNDTIYYVPVTKYIDGGSDKIDVIIQELSNGSLYHHNLISYLNNNTKVLNKKIGNDDICLTFNENIFDNLDTYNILEEVINSISLSIGDNYNVKEVIFKFDNKEIYKSVVKTIE